MFNGIKKDVLWQYTNYTYSVPENTNILEAVGAMFKEAIKEYCRKNDIDYKNSVTKHEYMAQYHTFEDMINTLLSQLDLNKTKKMTVGEIEKQLGYKIEIISD